MNISYNWLKDYLQFDLSPQHTADVLTSIGLETESVEKVETIKGGLQGLVIGKVLTCTAHPNSDHLHITTVDIGDDAPLQIVCGAPNIAAGQTVVVATIGSTLYIDDKELKIKRSKIRGEESFGMICSEVEIGVGNSHKGIIELPGDIKPGTLAKDYYNVADDYLFEIDITPNRVDATSHIGVARDLAAYLKQAGLPFKLTKPSVESFAVDKKDGGIHVEVTNPEACPRYSGVTIREVTVKESPEWLKNRLSAIGLRPINNVVDVTNFVLHETGHPLHAFDADYIDGDVIVRTLPDKTKFVALDEKEYALSANDLMICNSKEGMCIAGVFGGLHSGVTQKTKTLFLESACFNPMWVRKTARRHGLSTDSSFRFERGVDPNNTLFALKRAAMLIKEVAGGEIEGEIRDLYPCPVEMKRVTLSYERVNSVVGKEIASSTIKSILLSLDFEIEKETPTDITLRIPTYRVDVVRDVDIIEEILRIYGYNNVEISDSLKANLSHQTETDRKHTLQTRISEQLSACGFSEIMNNSLTKKAYYDNNEMYPADNCVALLNPLSSDLNVMRQTLIYGGMESIAYNRNRKNSDICFYEFGNCYYLDKVKQSKEVILAGYSEQTHLALWICGKRTHKNWASPEQDSTVFELKAHILNILARMGISKEEPIFEPINSEPFTSGMKITAQQRQLGHFGIVSEKLCNAFDIDAELYFGELDWDTILQITAPKETQFEEIPKYPTVSRDLALLIDKDIVFADIERIARKTEKKLLKDISLFDVYEGKNLPQGKKSYAVNFVLQDSNKTLTDRQIDTVMQKIQHQLESELNATLR